MKVPYFDIRSHFLLWMILSKVFLMYINADSQSAMLITEARSAPRAMEIQVYWHIFRRKHSRFQMQASEHKMYLSFCLYRLERLRVNTNPKNWINFVWTVQLLPFSISFSFCPFFFG